MIPKTEWPILMQAMADDIRTIKDAMPGKGVSPKDANTVVYKLAQIENNLRILSNELRNEG